MHTGLSGKIFMSGAAALLIAACGGGGADDRQIAGQSTSTQAARSQFSTGKGIFDGTPLGILPDLDLDHIIGGGVIGGNAPGQVTGPAVSVYKYLESRQCEGGGTTIAALTEQLKQASVDVISSSCGRDGKVYIAMCGAPDGAIGIFEVPVTQQLQARHLGFELLSTLPQASRTPCE